MRRLLRLALGAARVLGWVLLASLVAVELAESTGLLRALVRESLTRRLGAAGAGLELEAAELDLFSPALELRGLVLTGAGQPPRIECARYRPATFLPWSPARARIEIEGGRISLSRPLLERMRGMRSGLGPASGGRAPEPAFDLDVSGLELELELEGVGRFELGRAELVLARDEHGRPMLAGALVPPGAKAGGREGVHLVGRSGEEGVLLLSARARRLELDLSSVAEGSPLEPLRRAGARGKLELDLEVVLDATRGRCDEAALRLALEHGVLAPPGIGRELDSLALALSARLSPPGADPLAVSSWRGAWTVGGRFGAGKLHGGGRFGLTEVGADRARAWLACDRLPLDLPLRGLLGESAYLPRLQRALAPRGSAPLHAGLCLRDEPLGGGARWTSAVEIAPRGEAELSYLGFHDPGEEPDQGFPLPVGSLHGRVLFAHDAHALRPTRVALELEGRHHAGGVRLAGLVSSPPVDLPPSVPGAGLAELDLSLVADPLPVDGRLERAFYGLRSFLPPETLWQRYGPSGGELGARARLVRRAGMRRYATEIELALEGVDLRWSPLPVPMLGMRGTVLLRDDGQHAFGVGFAGRGGLRTSRSVAIAGRVRSDGPPGEGGGIDSVRVEVEQASLAGDDPRLLADRLPELARALEELQPRGFVHVRYERTSAAPGAEPRTTVEIEAGAPTRLTPAAFKMVTSDVRGRLLLSGRGEEALEPAAAPLLGTWERGVEVAFLTQRDARGQARIGVLAAGIDPSSKSLLGSLSQALGGNLPLSSDALRVEGRVDLSGLLDPLTGSLLGTWRLHLRESTLVVGASGLAITDLEGLLELSDGSLRGRDLRARVGRTPIEIEEARLAGGPSGMRLSTRFQARDLPLDREHLRGILNPATLEPLLGELGLEGRIDLEDAELVVEASARGAQRVSLLGGVLARDTKIRLGLPLEARHAALRIEQLELENGRLRARASIERLTGAIAGRRLGPVSMLVTYVEPRLAIESIDGTLEGGRIRPLGTEAERAGTAFSIDLVPPFPFQLALELEEVQLSGLLRDIFASNLAAQGTLDCRLRLVGDTENLLDLTGAGAFDLSNSRLWSVPVFRALFSQLGLDATATFDNASTNVRIRDGVIRTDDIELHSPLLRLVGSGTVDLDGSLQHEFELRYSILDWVGPLRRLVYEIQNRLVSVAIRGSLDRPRVALRGPFSGLFLDRDLSYRALPLPDFSRPPERW